MRRYWFSPECQTEDKIELEGAIFHHIVEVCRQQVGSRFEMITEGEWAYLVQMEDIQNKKAFVRIIEKRRLPSLEKPLIHLAVSLPKFPTLSAVIEKSVEMGVHQIHPFLSDYSFVRKWDSRFIKQFDRWQRIVQQASQQTGRGDLVEVKHPISIDLLLQEFQKREKAAGIFPFEGEAPQHARQALSQLVKHDLNEVWVFVGSEGGYSSREVKLFADYGLNAMTLGPQVLKVETACLVLVSILKYEMNLWK